MLQSIIWQSFMTNPLISHCIVISPLITRSETYSVFFTFQVHQTALTTCWMWEGLHLSTLHTQQDRKMQINNQWEMDNIPRGRRFSVSSERELPPPSALGMRFPGTSEDLHAWSIYRQVRRELGMALFGRKYISDISRISTVTSPTPLWAAKRSLRCPTGTSSWENQQCRVFLIIPSMDQSLIVPFFGHPSSWKHRSYKSRCEPNVLVFTKQCNIWSGSANCFFHFIRLKTSSFTCPLLLTWRL